MDRNIHIPQKSDWSNVWAMPASRLINFKNREPEADKYSLSAIRFLTLESVNELCRLIIVDRQYIYLEVNVPVYNEFFIPKKKGGKRKILAPTPFLKMIQQRLNYYLQAVYLAKRPECSHGFIIRPNFSPEVFNIVSNAKPHAGKKFVMNIDLENFFPSISARRVKDLFSGPHFQFPNELAAVLALINTYKKCLPVGAPASPVIANLICLEMDKEMMAFCKEKNITYTRYADDLTISSDTYFDEAIISGIREIIGKHRFVVNEKKFRVQSRQSKQTVTGLVVNKKPNVDRRYIRRLRAIMHHWKLEGLDNAVRKHLNLEGELTDEDRAVFTRKTKGSINFVGMVRGHSDIVYRKMNATFESFFEPFDHSIQLEMWKRPY